MNLEMDDKKAVKRMKYQCKICGKEFDRATRSFMGRLTCSEECLDISFKKHKESNRKSANYEFAIGCVSTLVAGLIILLTSLQTGEFNIAADAEEKFQVTSITQNANSFAYHMLFLIIAVFYFWERHFMHSNYYFGIF